MYVTGYWPMACVFVGTSGLVWAGVMSLRRHDRRIDIRIASASERHGDRSHSPHTEATGMGWWSRLLSSCFGESTARQDHLRRRLQHAGYAAPSAAVTFVAAQYLGAAALVGLTIASCQRLHLGHVDLILFPALAGGMGFLAPTIWLSRQKRLRQRVLNRSLPDFLDLLVAFLEGGLSLEGAIQRVSTELESAHPVLGREIRRVQREMELGASADRGLQNMSERTDLDVVRALSTVCGQARRFGSKVAIALRLHADTLRHQRIEAAEEAAQKAAVKVLIPTLLLLFPATFIVLAGPAVIQIYDSFRSAALASE